MADVLTAISIATAGVSLCVEAITTLKKVSTAAKDARANINTTLTLLGRTRSRLELVRVTLLTLQKNNADAGVVASFISFSQSLNSALQKVHDEVSRIVDGASRIGIAKRLTWALNKSKIQELIRLLEREDRHLVEEFSILNSLTSLRTQHDIERLTKLSDERSEPKAAFSGLSVVDGKVETVGLPYKNIRTTRIWLGHVLRENHADEYLRLRDQLSEAAYIGDWDLVFETLDCGFENFGESWVNAPRMKSKSQHTSMSMWLPLHQAVYLHASIDVVQRLLDLGACKTLRTRNTEFSHANMSALELAYELEVFYLYDILRPTIKRPVPPSTLLSLENNFHYLIRSELGQRVNDEKIYLPVLEALTELDGDTVWFPVSFGNESAGYLYQLYDRELQVKSINIQNKKEEILYLITEEGILETDEIFNFVGDLESLNEEMAELQLSSKRVKQMF